MKINRSNYESYFIDYIDGTLSDDLVDDLLDFLQENPDLAEELNAVKSMTLEPQQSTFTAKASLYKNTNEISADSFEMQAVAYLEGDLKEPAQQQFLTEIADDSDKLKTLHLLQKAKLNPNLAIVYPNKKELLRQKNRAIYFWVPRIAALLLIFFSVWAIVPKKQHLLPDKTVADQTQVQQAPSPIDFPIETDDKIASNVAEQPVVEETYEKPAKPEKEPVEVEPVKRIPVQPIVGENQETELLAMRSPVPEQIQPIKAEIKPAQIEVSKMYVSSADKELVPQQPSVTVDEYLAHKIINAPKGESFTFNNLANAGLNAVENITNERFNVERTESGKLRQIKFDSRLIAFSIPFGKNR